MRRFLILLLAGGAALLAGHALSLAQFAAFVQCPAASIASPGDPQSVTVLANGWQAQTTFHATTCAGATSAYSFTPDATPKVTFAVTSPGFTTGAVSTTIARTVEATIWLRQVEPNNLLPTETTSGADCVVTYVLSDFINLHDTATATFLSGAYVSGAVTSTAKSGLAVTNNSTQAHLTPVCAWVTENNLAVTSSQTFTVEVSCFHARPQGGKQVQAVKFTASDGTNNATCLTSTMTQSARITAGNPVAIYSCTFAAGAFAGLTSGACAASASCAISIDFTAYPIVGDVTLTASNGQDGVPIAITVRTPNLRPLRVVWDQAGTHTPVYAWVQSTGTCATNACVSASATDPGTGAAANYATVYTAAQNCQSYNNANRSHNDTSGCVIEVRAGTYNGFDPTTNLSTLTVGLTWLTIAGAPGTTNATVVFQRASASSGTAQIADRTKFIGVGFTQVNSTYGASYNEEIVGTDGADTGPINIEALFDKCSFVSSVAGGWPMIYKVGLRENYNTTLNQLSGDSSLTGPFGGQHEAALLFGSTISGVSPVYNLYTALGNIGTGIQVSEPPTPLGNEVAETGMVDAFNTWNKVVTPLQMTGSFYLPAGNFADVQNVYEKTTVDAGVNHHFIADGDLNPFVNYIAQYDTIAGGRRNFAYNDTSNDCVAKQGVILYEVIDPMAVQGYNIKRDTFATENAARICNWVDSHGVGFIGRVANEAADSTTAPSSVSWLGEYFGLTGSSTANNEGYGKSVAFTTNASASGTDAGGGLYTITGGTGSPAYGRVPSGLAGLPFDLAGTTRKNDGTGCAGAYESC